MRHLLATFCCAFLIAPALHADDHAKPLELKDFKQFRDEVLKLWQDATTIIAGVTDEQSAQAARPKLQELWKKRTEMELKSKAMEARVKQLKLTPEQEKLLKSINRDLFLNTRKTQEATHAQLWKNHPTAYQVLESTEWIQFLQKEVESIALRECGEFKEAAIKYIKDNSDDMLKLPGEGYPRSLAEVLKMKDKPLFFTPTSINDPWGQPYQLAFDPVDPIKETDPDKPRLEPKIGVYVWTVSPYGQGKKVIGNKPAGK